MRIEVSQEDIMTGVPGSFCKCPVALALERAGYRWVVVGGALITWQRGKEDFRRVETPKDVRSFITRFDTGFKVSSFSFDMPEGPC